MIKIKFGPNRYKKLCVFDFDGTLFKSPEKPSNHKGNWWIEKISLGPETVGKIPDESYWNSEVVNDANRSLKDTNNYCILLTGRVDNIFEDRIKELLKQKNLNFKLVKLNSFGSDTGKFKIKIIKQILNKYGIKNIEMWEDEEDKIQLYTEEFENKYNFKINKV